jgi:small-conductance mechanosensitive channel
MPATASEILHVALLFVVTFFVLRIITSFIGYLFKQAASKKERNELREKQAKGILLIVQIIVWTIGFLFLIDNLGFDITTLVAGLGIGGIAIALAAQTVLGDLFSYLVIFFDKPFEIGDFIIVEDKMGTVEYIGIKTTRIRTLSGEQLVCSNTDLTDSRVHNYKRMEERRIAFSFGVVYNTPAAKLKIIPPLVKKIIEDLENTRFDRAHFKSFGDFSLDFEVVYYVLSADYNIYMDKQQSINLRIFELFEKEQIEFAFPTQTLFVTRINKEEMQIA